MSKAPKIDHEVVISDLSQQTGNCDHVHDFVSLVVHDLQVPLVSMRTLLRYFAEGRFDLSNPLHRRLLKSAEIALQRSETIIRDLIDSARAQKLGLVCQLDFWPLSDLLENSRQLVAPTAIDYEIAVHMPVVSPSIHVHVDRDLFLRVMDNLLFNAIKNTPRGGTVAVEVEKKETQVVVAVSNEMEFVPELCTVDIFDKYVMIEMRKEGKIRGAGLGLYFCKLAVEAMNGRIWMEPTAGGRISFRFGINCRGE